MIEAGMLIFQSFIEIAQLTFKTFFQTVLKVGSSTH
jgi:hypothetical protein